VIAVAFSLALAFSAPLSAAPQATAPTSIGLALSGGSAKGIAHIGVLRTLERLGVRVDVVTGTSIGAVVGGMYALGLSVDSIEGVIRAADWPGLLSDAMPRERRSLDQKRHDERAILSVPLEGVRVELPSGAIIGSNALRLLEQVTWRASTTRRFADLPRPFGAVATDLETGEAVPLRAGVLAEALRASAGLPGAVEPIVLDGRLLVDGGLSRNLPAVDARDLGADFVICSDVSEPIDSAEELLSFVDVLSQLASLSMLESTLAQREICDVLIVPTVDDLSSFDFDRVDEWIARGEEATLAHERSLRAATARPPARSRVGVPADFLGDSVLITGISIEGTTDPRMTELIRRELEIGEGDYVGHEDVDAGLSELESSGLFGLVRFRLEGQGDGAALVVSVEERPRDRLAVGFRYDDERRAALLFTATVHNVGSLGAVSRLDLRVGEETLVSVSTRRRLWITGRVDFGASVGWAQASLGVTTFDITSVAGSIGFSPTRSAYLGAELAYEGASVQAGTSVESWLAATVFDHETLDRIDFPRSGIDASGRLEWGSVRGVRGRFANSTLDALAYLPVATGVTVDVGTFIGHARVSGLPSHRSYSLGGAHRSTVFRTTHATFQGLGSQELSGGVVQVARVGVRWEPARDWFLRGGVDVGAARDEWRFPLSRPMTGWALSGGIRSRIGPVVGSVSKVWGARHDPRLSISVGRSF